MTLAIPFSFLADAVLRGQPPSGLQMLAAIPITVSFIGAAVVDNRKSSTSPSSAMADGRHSSASSSSRDEDAAALLNDDGEET